MSVMETGSGTVLKENLVNVAVPPFDALLKLTVNDSVRLSGVVVGMLTALLERRPPTIAFGPGAVHVPLRAVAPTCAPPTVSVLAKLIEWLPAGVPKPVQLPVKESKALVLVTLFAKVCWIVTVTVPAAAVSLVTVKFCTSSRKNRPLVLTASTDPTMLKAPSDDVFVVNESARHCEPLAKGPIVVHAPVPEKAAIVPVPSVAVICQAINEGLSVKSAAVHRKPTR